MMEKINSNNYAGRIFFFKCQMNGIRFCRLDLFKNRRLSTELFDRLEQKLSETKGKCHTQKPA